MKKLSVFVTIYSLTYLGLAFKIYLDQGDIDNIMASASHVDAEITDVTSQTRIKRGVQIKEYDIHYRFEADGAIFTSAYSLPESSYQKYSNNEAIEVVYNASSPNLNMPKSSVEGYRASGTIPEKLIKLVIFAFVVALIPYALIAVCLGWMKLK